MNINFLNLLAQMNLQDEVHITLTRESEGSLLVLVSLTIENYADKLIKDAPPPMLLGPTETLDEFYF
ncbi:hypothetical protein [Flavobacterium sp. TAB 87]|uniref:hypothetical protein n=1 Tax=Flavobacterium sp. TAB 87 TaxID=1729581 RepID=UPI00076CF1EE|nr:hypothetical protein [Flavobacterium sp. TAB 87]KVV15061.1 hypothetical protein AP058_01619 [Flavobacterium sp. TAB 87]